MQENKTSYQALIKMAEAITSSLDSDKMMDSIIQEVVSVLAYADTGLLYLYDEGTQKLRLESIVGFPQEYCELAAFNPGESLSGKVFLKGESKIVNGFKKCREIILGMPESKLKNYLSCSRTFPYSIMSVPLKVNNKIIGVLTVDNFNYPGKEFMIDDLELLQAAANHVSIVITKSQLIQRMEEFNSELKKGYNVLEQTLNIHQELTTIALEGKGFQEIVDLLSEMVKFPVGVYDLEFKPVVISSKTQDLKITPKIIESPEIKRLIRNRQWQEMKLLDIEEKLLIFPIAGAQKLLGFLVVSTPDTIFPEIIFVAINYGSTVLALEWLKQEELLGASQKLNGEFLRDVLFSDWNNHFMIRATDLGFDPSGFYAIVLVKYIVDEESFSGNINIGKDSGTKSIISLIKKLELRGIVLQERNYFCILISFFGKDEKYFYNQMKEFAKNILSIDKKFQVGIGSVYSDLINSRISYEEAKQCLSLLNDYSFKTKTLQFKELGILRLILKNNRTEVIDYIINVLRPILEYDREKKSDLLTTLKLYMKFNRALHLIAKNMNVHTNTVYYRIKKVEELLKVDLNDQDIWFDIQVVCKLLETLELDIY